jgi:hypothetical protein
MSLRSLGTWLALAAAVLATGCATPVQPPVDLAADYFSAGRAKAGRVGVVMSELPKPDTAFPGAGCLLCLAVANGNHSALSRQVQSFSTTELKPLPADLVALLKKQGLDAVLIDEPLKLADLPDLRAGDAPNKARKDFTALKDKHKVARLLVVDVTALGVWRSYSAYVPTDVPKAVFNGSAAMIDLSTHTLEWFMPLTFSRAAEGNWDEAPKFPGLSNAYYQVLESGMDAVKKPFVSK